MKLLFDLEAENDLLSLIQGCALLSMSHSGTGNGDKDGCHWLSIAIRLAKNIDMHNQAKTHGSGRKSYLYRRVWQCLVIRDRLMSLGVHRPLLIPPDQYDFTQSSVTVHTLFPELDETSVRMYGTRRSTMELFIRLYELSVQLTDVIMLVYPPGDRFCDWTSNNDLGAFKDANECRKSLSNWFDDTLQFRDNEDDMVFAYITMMDVFY